MLDKSDGAEEILEGEMFLESSIFSQDIRQKFIEMTKNCTKFLDRQNTSFLQNITELYETVGEAAEEGLRNFLVF